MCPLEQAKRRHRQHPGAPGGIEPDVVVEQVTEETADGEITCLL